MEGPNRDAVNLYLLNQISPPIGGNKNNSPPRLSSRSVGVGSPSGEICQICGYNHRNHSGSLRSNTSNNSPCRRRGGNGGNDNKNGGGSSGGGGSSAGGGSGGGSCGGGGGGDADNKGSGTSSGGSGNDQNGGSDDRVGGDMNGDDINICPDVMTNFLFVAVICVVLGVIAVAFYCRGASSFSDCFESGGGSTPSCSMNENLLKFFNKTGPSAGMAGSSSTSIPPHLHETYQQFKNSLKDSKCLEQYGKQCDGLVNYASLMAGASIISTGNTQDVQNPMMCRCQDKKLGNQLCTPKTGPCKDCRCDKIPVETIITEESKLIPGKCWAFSGAGEIQIRLFFPIIVIGASIHHPPKGMLPPGFFSSAPNVFDLWGMDDKTANSSHFLGKFVFTADGGSTQIFEVQNLAPPVSQVKFNFISNHGNPNYTAVYKLEVHGLLDST